MRFRTVRIDPSKSLNRYVYRVSPVEDVDRAGRPKSVPHPGGWFHFPEAMDPREAFDALKGRMMADAMAQIDGLAKSVAELAEMTWAGESPTWKRKPKAKKR